MKRASRSRVRDRTVAGKVADIALATSIILAPVLGGGSNLVVLPVLVVSVLVALSATLASARKIGTSVHVTPLVIVLFALSLFTLLQAIPLPASWVATLSPKAVELRDSMPGGTPAAFLPLTYEVSATLREAMKLALYALVALVAYERVRIRGSLLPVTLPLVIAGLSAVVLAIVHRVLGIQQMLGFLPTRRPTSEMLTTFVNANHSAGFMALACLASLGFAASRHAHKRSYRVGAYVVAGLSAMTAVLTVSRGGIFALVGGLALFGVLVVRRKKGPNVDFKTALRSAMPAGIGLVVALPVMLAFSTLEAFLGALSRTGEADLGPGGKFAAFKDALPMVRDHLFFGIGRGSYASLYTHYKESPAQLIFAYPENIVVQLIADWGVVVGTLALGLLLVAVTRRILRAETEAIGALAGVAAVVAQNIVDFSLELPGVALPVAAILGATGVGVVGSLRLSVRGEAAEGEPPPFGLAAGALLAAASLLLIGLTSAAFVAGDADRDLERLQHMSKETEMAPLEEFEAIAARHPTNAYVAAIVSYAAETSTPPRFPDAARWAGRALFLAPTYAEPHLAIGRLLVIAGRREQGFTALRDAWRYSALDHRMSYVQQIASLARSAEELLEAVPRRNAELDVPDEYQLVLASRLSRKLGRGEWSKSLLASISISDAPPESLELIALESISAGELTLADAALDRLRDTNPNDPDVALLYTKGLLRKGDIPGARAEARRLLSLSPKNPTPGLKMLLELALLENDDAEASRLFSRLVEATPPTRQGQVELARFEAEIDVRSGNPGHALKTLSHAIDLAPEALDLRTLRARILRDTGHLTPAASDLKYVLGRQPQNRGVQRLLAQVEAMRQDRPSATPRAVRSGGESREGPERGEGAAASTDDWGSVASDLSAPSLGEDQLLGGSRDRAKKPRSDDAESGTFGF